MTQTSPRAPKMTPGAERETQVRNDPNGGSQNETIPMEMRSPQGAELSDGPHVVNETGRDYYKTASYKTGRGNVRSDR